MIGGIFVRKTLDERHARAVDQIAEDVGEFAVDAGLKFLPCKIRVRFFRRNRVQIKAPDNPPGIPANIRAAKSRNCGAGGNFFSVYIQKIHWPEYRSAMYSP